ncbi:hypothetical protein H7X69_01540 [Candidatus Saccharibacteria bacterium]|nr:hypothetical protein [Candidatus Saccharibacteria bacterium]
MTTNTKQNGAVSLFIVIFTTLLVTIITVSFVRIMLSDQRQATAADLSLSAYDSAQAGVEDAKRALLDYQSECASGDASRCTNAHTLINSIDCNQSLSRVVSYVPGQEVLVQQNSSDGSAALQQAYTCVKITTQTDDYAGILDQDDTKLVPLTGVSSFDSVRLEWFSAKNLQGTSTVVDVPLVSASPPLISQSDWTTTRPNRPSLMRTQLIQFGDAFTLSDFDNINASSQSNANTLFLYPSTIVDSPKTFVSDVRKVASPGPTQIHCQSSLGSGGYACSATISLPTPINAGSRTAYLRLTSLYKEANYRVTLLAAGATVKFNGVQPQIDSTGRANDLFRRVQSRVEVIDTDFPYPDAAVDISGDFCKKFIVTNDPADYPGTSASTCTP